MKRTLLTLVGVLAAVAVAVPAALATTFTVRAGGIVIDQPYSGSTVQTLGIFRINLKAGPGHKVTYINRGTSLNFRSLQLSRLVYTREAVKITGIGLANGQRVHFTAIATKHNAQGVAAFRIAWNHQAAHGGNLKAGNVRITPISVS